MIIRFSDYELDVRLMELRRGGTGVAIEPQVFDLLRVLIENRDRVVTKDELIDAVWGGRIVSEATLNSRINAARREVGDNGTRQEIIRTLPCRGFRFVGIVTGERDEAGPAAAVPSHEHFDGGAAEEEHSPLDVRFDTAL